MNMLHYVIDYLNQTKDMPLVLGGEEDIDITVIHDCSLGTGPKSRSITGLCGKLSKNAGAVTAKSFAQQTTALSSFEGELEGTTHSFKKGNMISNILDDIGVERASTIKAYNDNLPMIEFVKGNGIIKGVRHMERRMWYTREQFEKGNIELMHIGTKENTSDKLTKLGSILEHQIFTTDIMGLHLLGYNYFEKVFQK